MVRIILAILLFCVIVLFHEFGHFLLAKRAGICVEEFAIGIGPTIVGVKRGETKYSIKCLPLGGCCVMKGEDEEDDDPRSYGSKSAPARFSVIVAGPLFNFLLAFILSLFVVGLSGADPAIIGGMSDDSAAYEAGLEEGDRIIRLDGSRIYNFREISLYNFMHTSDPDVDVVYERDGERHEVTVTRHEEDGSYLLGVTMSEYADVGVLGTIKYSALEVRYQIKSVLVSLRYLFSGRASLNDLSGPVGIINMIGQSYSEAITYGVLAAVLSLMSFAVLLSANLGVLNLLPIPALDGGRILFILIEVIRRKKISPEREGMVNFVAMVVLIVFMFVIMANDFRNIFFV